MKVWATCMWLVLLQKRGLMELPSLFHCVRLQWSGLSPGTESAGNLISGFPDSVTMRSMFLWFTSYLVYGVLLQQPKWNKTGVLAKLRVSEEVTFNLRFERVGFPGGSDERIYLQCGRPRFDPWVRKMPCRKDWLPLQYSCLENSKDRGAWQATVHGVTKNRILLSA